MKTRQALEIYCENNTEFTIDKNWIETALNEYCRMINHKAKFKVSDSSNNVSIDLSGSIDVENALRQHKLKKEYSRI